MSVLVAVTDVWVAVLDVVVALPDKLNDYTTMRISLAQCLKWERETQ